MSALATALATGASLAALGKIAANDPKRRRAFRLPPPEKTRGAGLLWTAALLPGALLPFWSGAGGFFVWFGAITVAGWVVAAVSPDRNLMLRVKAAAAIDRMAAALSPVLSSLRAAAGRIGRAAASRARPAAAVSDARTVPAASYAELERRLQALEAEVAALRAAAVATLPEAAIIERPALSLV